MIDKVTRYSLKFNGGQVGMHPTADGEFIRYADHLKALETLIRRLVEPISPAPADEVSAAMDAFGCTRAEAEVIIGGKII